MSKIYLRPSGILKYEACPRAYQLQYINGWRNRASGSALAFGTAVHEAVTSWIVDTALGNPEQDIAPIERFRVAWKRETSKQILEYSTRFSPSEMMETGEKLTEAFPQKWGQLGYFPLFDDDGPMVERRLEVEIGDGVVLSGQADFLGMDLQGHVVNIDFKTPVSPASEEFTILSDQLTAYQVLIEAHKDRIGIERVDKAGFMELLKRKVSKTSRGSGPQVLDPMLAPRRDNDTVQEFLQKVLWIAEDIRRGRLHRAPQMAWNSPCDLCDFKGFCTSGSIEGLVDREGRPFKTIPITVAA